MFSLTQTFRVEWGETDSASIIFYPNYYRWFDRAAHELLRVAGLPTGELNRQGFVQPILECGAHFHTPLIFDDVVTLTAEITEVRAKTFRIAYRVVRGDALVAEGYEVRAWVAQTDPLVREKIAALPIPADYSALLRGETPPPP